MISHPGDRVVDIERHKTTTKTRRTSVIVRASDRDCLHSFLTVLLDNKTEGKVIMISFSLTKFWEFALTSCL